MLPKVKKKIKKEYTVKQAKKEKERKRKERP